MKTIAKLLIVVTELAVRCRANLLRDHLVAWSGDDNLMLTEQTAKSTSPSSVHHLSPGPNHASSHCTSTPTPTSELLHRTDQAGIDLKHAIEDHVFWPAAIPHEIDSPPMEIDLAPIEINPPLMEINSPTMELEEEITQPDVGAAVDHIPMNRKEVPEYQLVFHKDIFPAPLYDGQPFKDKWQTVFEAIEDTSDGGQLPVLVVTRNVLDFIRKFNGLGCPTTKVGGEKSPVAADIAARQVTSCLINSMTWRAVYQKRLGIDFESAEKWFQDTVKHIESPNSVDKIFPRINEWFLIYIILVDMIITILPNGNQKEQPVDRIKSFQTAVRCFEDYTRLTLRGNEGFGDTSSKMRYANIWKFITYWKENDENYAWLHLPSRGRDPIAWKNFFNLIFAYSIQHFTKEFKTDLYSKFSHYFKS